MMRRIFIAGRLAPGQTLTVDQDDGHHLARVLRILPGETLVAAGANGPYEAVARSVDVRRGVVEVEVGAPAARRDPQIRLLVVQGLAKGDKVDEVVQRVTEIGACGVWVTPMERTVGQLTLQRADARLGRWKRIAGEAAGQAQRDEVPDVRFYSAGAELAMALRGVKPDLSLLLDERETVHSIRSAFAGAFGERRQRGDLSGRVVVVVVGPEGGFSDGERAWWRGENGAQSVTLGRRILRTETAGLAACAAVLYEAGELGG